MRKFLPTGICAALIVTICCSESPESDPGVITADAEESISTRLHLDDLDRFGSILDSEPRGNPEIYLMNDDGSDLRQLSFTRDQSGTSDR